MKRLITEAAGGDPRFARLAAALDCFDALVAEGADLERLVGEAERLAGLPIGLVEFAHARVVLSSSGLGSTDDVVAAVVAHGLRGREACHLTLESGRRVVAASIDIANGRVGVVWCETGSSCETAEGCEFIVERLAAAAASALVREGVPAHAEVLLVLPQALEGTASQVHALREFGFDPACRHLVLGAEAVPAGSMSPDVLANVMRRVFADQKALAVVGAVRSLAAAVTLADVNPWAIHDALCASLKGAHVGVATAFAVADPSLAAAWRAILRAVERRSPVDGPIDADGEAVTAALARSVDELAESHDVQRVLALSDEERRVLAAVLDAGSLRRAGERLHMHHTTVAYHVERLSERLGFRVLGPEGRKRPVLALAAAEAVEARRRSPAASGTARAAAG